MVRALAFIELGQGITESLITPQNIRVYTPEQHIDNPMGTRASDHLVRDSESGELRSARETEEQEDPTGRGGWYTIDPDRDQQLKGAAFPGLQAENPELYQVSDSGLANHIYNSIEWSKAQLLAAVRAGPTPEGRMFLGSGLHAVEDYFAHSNFIEVALNGEIDRALQAERSGEEAALPPTFLWVIAPEGSEGPYVDTLYDATAARGYKP